MLAREKRDEDPGVTVADDERGAGEAVHGHDLDRAGQPGRSASEDRRRQDQRADRQPRHARGADVAADDVHGEADDRVSHEDPRDDTGRDAEDEAPMNSRSRDRADHQALADRPRRGLQHLTEIADGPADEVIHHRDGDVVQEQRRDGLVDAAPVPERAGHADPHSTGERSGEAHQPDGKRRWERAEVNAGEDGRHATDDEAPSPPITSKPARAGSACRAQ